jgi:large subunit ribosomal protein L29
MKAAEIRKLSTEQINSNIANLKEELFNLRFQLAVGQLENTARIKQVKKAIARMKTVLSEQAE